MKTGHNGGIPRKWIAIVLTAIVTAGISWGLLSVESGLLRGQVDAPEPSTPPADIFTPAHSSIGEAMRHFFGIRREAQQPLAYTHRPHIEIAELQCDFCHATVSTGPQAGIPGVKTCMTCHEFIATDRPEIQKLAAYNSRGEDIPWERVYGWTDEAHVRFNHAPHIRAEVACTTCHGDVAQMNDAKRVDEHTIGFCVQCHAQRQVSNDCLTCHY
jgi:hypothetical protein